jgi:hypothetical protein
MSKRSQATMVSLIVSLVAAICGWAFPTVAAGGGPPQGGGGCHMVFSPGPTGLDHMMSGSANGQGAANMAQMLARFSPEPFCGA